MGPSAMSLLVEATDAGWDGEGIPGRRADTVGGPHCEHARHPLLFASASIFIDGSWEERQAQGRGARGPSNKEAQAGTTNAGSSLRSDECQTRAREQVERGTL